MTPSKVGREDHVTMLPWMIIIRQFYSLRNFFIDINPFDLVLCPNAKHLPEKKVEIMCIRLLIIGRYQGIQVAKERRRIRGRSRTRRERRRTRREEQYDKSKKNMQMIKGN
jgi:hypothetical protein